MPTVELQPAVRLFVRDETDSRSQLAFNVQHGISAAAGHSAAATLRGAVAGLSGCIAEQQQVEYRVEELAPASAGDTPARIAGVLIFETAEPDQYAIVVIPALRSEFIAEDGVQLDSSSPEISGLVAELTSGNWCNPWGHQLVALAAAFVQIRP